MKNLSRLFALTFFLCAAPSVVSAQGKREHFSGSVTNAPVDNLEKAARDFRRQGKKERNDFSFPTRQGVVHLRLIPHDIRAKTYRGEVTNNGTTTQSAVEVDLFRSEEEGPTAESFARVAVIRDPKTKRRRVSGVLRSRGEYYDLRSRNETPEGVAPTLDVSALSDEELKQLPTTCAVEAPPDAFATTSSANGSTPAVAAAFSSPPFILEIATEGDVEYTQRFGGAAQSEAERLAVLNAVDGIYRAELNISIVVTYQHTWASEPDPYTSTDPGILLDSFRNHWNANFRSVAPYDTAHLWTGKMFTGTSTVGLAWVGTVCSSVYSYGLSRWFTDRGVSAPIAAHEIGHNLGANHDPVVTNGSCYSTDFFIMCPSVVYNVTTFSPASKTSVNATLTNATCMSPSVALPSPPSAPRMTP